MIVINNNQAVLNDDVNGLADALITLKQVIHKMTSVFLKVHGKRRSTVPA